MYFRYIVNRIECSNRKRKTKREEFPEIMDEIMPWDEWGDVIMPYYPSDKRSRPLSCDSGVLCR